MWARGSPDAALLQAPPDPCAAGESRRRFAQPGSSQTCAPRPDVTPKPRFRALSPTGRCGAALATSVSSSKDSESRPSDSHVT